MTAQTTAALDAMRTIVGTIKPASADGFEGLVATALAAVTGQLVRLAKSGLQFGRDMRSGSTDFVIAAECKRYDNSLRLEDLAGKAMLAGRFLGGKADLWLVCATREIGEATVEELAGLLYDQGISMVALDWPDAGLPPLAILLAAAMGDVESWFAAYAPTERADMVRHLTTIVSDPRWAAARDELGSKLDRTEAGLGPLRAANDRWLKARFADPELSRDSFGQVIGIAPAGLPAVARQALADELGLRLRAPRAGPAIVVVTGDEGVGKTWLVARWWAGDPDRPILLLVSGRRARLLDPASPLKNIAQLLADESGRDDEQDIRFWCRRLERWKAEPVAGLRFVLVVDGLNEHAGEAWSDVLRGLAREMDALGGILCVTSRPHFWKRDVEPRLRTGIERRRIDVPPLSDAEVAFLLNAAGIKVDRVAPTVREFLRSPRVCVVAIRLIGSLALAPENLTIDRLLLEYWRDRLAERGDLLHHSVGAFHALLRSHARAWHDAPRRDFDRAAWESHSGLPASGRRYLADDLTEIEEGRFMTVSPDDEERYTFRREGLPFALALFLNDELRQRLKLGEAPREVINQIIGPIEAFDEASMIIASAIAIGCSETLFPAEGLAALIDRFTGLQNREDDAGGVVLAHLRERPEPFIDLLERPLAAASGAADQRIIERFVLIARDAPKVAGVLAQRLPRWLGQWSRDARAFGDSADAQRARHEARVDTALAEMAPEETALLDRLTWRTDQRPATDLVGLAALLLAGQPIAPLADGLAGFGLADFASDGHGAGDELAWAVRLNRLDGPAALTRLHEALAPIGDGSSAAIRRGIARALRLPGDRAGAERADRLAPPSASTTQRKVERYCETNPLDPATLAGDNLPEAIGSAAAIDRTTVWSTFHVGGDDRVVEIIAPTLARFDIDPLVKAISQIVATTPEREGITLRQIGLRLPEMAALINPAGRAALDRTLNLLRADRTRLAREDYDWIFAWISRALIAHEAPADQLDRLLALPPDIPLYVNLAEELRPLPPADVAPRLAVAAQAGGDVLRRTLFFLSAHPHSFNAHAADLLIDSFLSDDDEAASLAAEALLAPDEVTHFKRLLDRLEQGGRWVRPDDPGFARGRLIARAVIATKRLAALPLVSPRFVGEVAAALGGAATARFVDQMDVTMARISSPAPVDKPADLELFVGVDMTGQPLTRWTDAAAEPEVSGEEGWRRFAARMNKGLEETNAELEAIGAAGSAYHLELDAQGLSEIAQDPPLAGLAALAAMDPEPPVRWLTAILATSDGQALAQQRNMGLALAAALAGRDPALAAAAFQQLRDVPPPVMIVYGDHHVPLYEHLLYRLPRHALLDPLRTKAVLAAGDDLALGRQARFADVLGAAEWLDAEIATLAASALPGDVARGLTLAGLRSATDRSAALLAADHGPGFLGAVLAYARDAARHLAWARHWTEALATARDPVEAWRAVALAAELVDMRFISDWPAADPSWAPFAGAAFDRLLKAAEKREDSRRKTMFGHSAPSSALRALLADPLPGAV